MVGVVIPAYREGPRLGKLLGELPTTLPGVGRLIYLVVDDGSPDDTAAVARRAGFKVARHRLNMGKGGALLTGCEGLRRLGATAIVTMDADGQHRPEDLPAVLAPVLAGEADLVVGTRRLTAEMPGLMRAGNRALSGALELLFGVRVGDTQSGFRAFRADRLDALRWRARDYAVESEMLVRAVRAGLRVAEAPIATVYLDRYKGTQPLDGLRILRQLILWRIGI